MLIKQGNITLNLTSSVQNDNNSPYYGVYHEDRYIGEIENFEGEFLAAEVSGCGLQEHFQTIEEACKYLTDKEVMLKETQTEALAEIEVNNQNESIVYHGTPYKNLKFLDTPGRATWFTPAYELAHTFTKGRLKRQEEGEVIKAKITSNNPLNLRNINVTLSEDISIKEFAEIIGENPETFVKKVRTNADEKEINNAAKKGYIISGCGLFIGYSEQNKEELNNSKRHLYSYFDYPAVIKTLSEIGYDTVLLKEAGYDTMGVFSATQIQKVDFEPTPDLTPKSMERLEKINRITYNPNTTRKQTEEHEEYAKYAQIYQKQNPGKKVTEEMDKFIANEMKKLKYSSLNIKKIITKYSPIALLKTEKCAKEIVNNINQDISR